VEYGRVFGVEYANVIFAGIFAAGVIRAVPEFSVPVDRLAMGVCVDHGNLPFFIGQIERKWFTLPAGL
jgi:hypothetical protein